MRRLPAQATHAREDIDSLVRLLTLNMEQTSKLQKPEWEVADYEGERITRFKPLRAGC